MDARFSEIGVAVEDEALRTLVKLSQDVCCPRFPLSRGAHGGHPRIDLDHESRRTRVAGFLALQHVHHGRIEMFLYEVAAELVGIVVMAG